MYSFFIALFADFCFAVNSTRTADWAFALEKTSHKPPTHNAYLWLTCCVSWFHRIFQSVFFLFSCLRPLVCVRQTTCAPFLQACACCFWWKICPFVDIANRLVFICFCKTILWRFIHFSLYKYLLCFVERWKSLRDVCLTVRETAGMLLKFFSCHNWWWMEGATVFELIFTLNFWFRFWWMT